MNERITSGLTLYLQDVPEEKNTTEFNALAIKNQDVMQQKGGNICSGNDFIWFNCD